MFTQEAVEEIAREGRSRAEAEAALRRYVDVDIPKLYESLRDAGRLLSLLPPGGAKEAQSRETMEDRIVRRASEEIQRLQQVGVGRWVGRVGRPS